MKRIARDEVGHGELAWRIHAWACERLSDEQVAALAQAMAEAATAMIQSMVGERFTAETREALGLPSRAREAALARDVRARLWDPQAPSAS